MTRALRKRSFEAGGMSAQAGMLVAVLSEKSAVDPGS